MSCYKPGKYATICLPIWSSNLVFRYIVVLHDRPEICSNIAYTHNDLSKEQVDVDNCRVYGDIST
jgi:hypothetical protein